MIHIDWIIPDDIVMNDGFENKSFSKDVKYLKNVRLLRIGNNYYIRYEIENNPKWVMFLFHKNNGIYFGNVSGISDSNREKIEINYKAFHREEVLKNILG